MTNPLQAYALAERSVDSDDKGRLLVKVFQLILEKLDTIKVAVENGDYEKKFKELSKITTSLEILIGSLDMSYGEIPSRLRDIYYYLIKRLHEVHTSMNVKTLEECKEIISRVSDGFVHAHKAERTKGGAHAAQGPETRATSLKEV
jgi:flagellar biosynthetic protein FliS